MIKLYQNQGILSLWIAWNFFDMPKNLLNVWNNYFSFTLNYFSITLLLKTLISPWHKDVGRYPRGFDVKIYFEIFVSNLFSRIIGAIIRIILIFVGISALTLVFFLGLFIFLAWLISPILLIFGLFLSLWFLI